MPTELATEWLIPDEYLVGKGRETPRRPARGPITTPVGTRSKPPSVRPQRARRPDTATRTKRPKRGFLVTLARLAQAKPGINQRTVHPEPRRALSVAQRPGMPRRFRRFNKRTHGYRVGG
jgi:hypothetical protein